MNRSIALLCLSLCAVACKKADGLVLVTATASPEITDVTSLAVTVTAAGGRHSQPTPVRVDNPTIPPDVDFALRLPSDLAGAFTVHLDASGDAGLIASGEVTGTYSPGQSVGPLTLVLGAGGGGSGGDGGGPDDMTPPSPPSTPRQIAPLSGATVTSRHPTLHWVLPGGSGTAQVDLCAKRDCSVKISGSNAVVDASNTKATVDIDLPAGPVFWRVNVTSGSFPATHSATWEFFVGQRSADNGADVSFASVFDANGDGLADLFVGESGQAVLYPGAATGLDTANLETLNEAENGFAQAVASAGDINGDGFSDAIAGAVFADTDMGPNTGRVLLYLGGPNKLNTASIQLPIQAANGDGIGTTLGGGADLDGDGYADMIVGAQGNAPGRAWVVFGAGGTGGPTRVVELKPSDKTLAGDDITGAAFGSSFAMGDFNGDGFGDVAVGAPGVTQTGKPSGNGRVYVYFGGTNFPQIPQIIDGLNFTVGGSCCGGQNFGAAMAEAGDFNGDGRDDLVILAPLASYFYNQCGESPSQLDGQTLIYVGAATGAPTLAFQIPAKATTPATCGYVTGDIQNSAVAGAGDINGDGYADVVLGGKNASPGGVTSAGAAHLITGSGTGFGHTDISPPTPTMFGGFGALVGMVGSVTGTGTPRKSDFVVTGNGQIYRFSGLVTPSQNFAATVSALTQLGVPLGARGKHALASLVHRLRKR